MADPSHPGAPDPSAPRGRIVSVWRCPVCGSTDAGPDESRSIVDLTWMQCGACGEGGLCDPWEQDADWHLEIEIPAGSNGWPAFVAPVPAGKRWHELPTAAPGSAVPGAGMAGCARCCGAPASDAWSAATDRTVRSLVAESHYDVAITACPCGQQFACVFTERVDWVDGEDDQTWLVLPLTADEAEQLAACSSDALRELLHRLGAGRRYLLRTFATGAALTVAWRDDGFWIGPHD